MPTDAYNRPFRILSMDGAGVYGLAQALMLKRLCDADKNFLKGDSVSLFAGTSAGAVNSLFLASRENPRDAVDSGDMIRFWKDPQAYAGPTTLHESLLSLQGQVGWFSYEGFHGALKQYFKDLKMHELPHKVLITTFNWAGNQKVPPEKRSWRPKIYYNFPHTEDDCHCNVVDVAYGAGSPPGFRKVINGISDGGIFVPNPSMNAIAKAIAIYLSQTPHDIRRYGNYLYDTGREEFNFFVKVREFEGSNWAEAVGWAKAVLERNIEEMPQDSKEDLAKQGVDALRDFMQHHLDNLPNSKTVSSKKFMPVLQTMAVILVQKMNLLFNMVHYLNPSNQAENAISTFSELITKFAGSAEISDPCQFATHMEASAARFLALIQEVAPTSGNALRGLAILSVGNAGRAPFFWLPTFDFGMVNFNQQPTNPSLGNFYCPNIFVGLDAPSENVDYQAGQLLDDSFHRLNPQLFGPPDTFPALPATLLARFPFFREAIFKQIHDKVESSTDANDQIADAVKFIKSPAWKSGH